MPWIFLQHVVHYNFFLQMSQSYLVNLHNDSIKFINDLPVERRIHTNRLPMGCWLRESNDQGFTIQQTVMFITTDCGLLQTSRLTTSCYTVARRSNNQGFTIQQSYTNNPWLFPDCDHRGNTNFQTRSICEMVYVHIRVC